MSDVSIVVAALREEAQAWMDLPTGRPGQPGYLFPSLLGCLADRIEATIREGNLAAIEDELKPENSILRGRSR